MENETMDTCLACVYNVSINKFYDFIDIVPHSIASIVSDFFKLQIFVWLGPISSHLYISNFLILAQFVTLGMSRYILACVLLLCIEKMCIFFTNTILIWFLADFHTFMYCYCMIYYKLKDDKLAIYTFIKIFCFIFIIDILFRNATISLWIYIVQ